MAISYVSVSNAAGQNAGATGTGTASISVTMPGSTVNDQSRVFVVSIATGTQPAYDGSWTELFRNTVIGTGTVSAGGGQRYMSVYYRDKTSAWSTIPSVALDTASALSHWVGAVAINKTDTTYSWNTPTFSTAGSDFSSSDTAHSDTTGSLTTSAGGFLIVATANNDNVTMTSGALAQSGATLGTVTERADGGTATGNDVAGKLHTCSVTTGASAALTFTGTLSAASQGGSIVIQQTETAPAVTNLANYSSPGDFATQQVTASLTIPNNSVVLVFTSGSKNGGTWPSTNAYSVSDSISGSSGWTAIGPWTYTNVAFYGCAGQLFYKVFSTGGSATITIDSSVSVQFGYDVLAVTGANTSNPIVQTKSALVYPDNAGNTNTSTITLDAAPTSGNTVIWLQNCNNTTAAAMTLPSGLTSAANPATIYQPTAAAYSNATTATTYDCTDCGQGNYHALTFVTEIRPAAAAVVPKPLVITQAVNRAATY